MADYNDVLLVLLLKGGAPQTMVTRSEIDRVSQIRALVGSYLESTGRDPVPEGAGPDALIKAMSAKPSKRSKKQDPVIEDPVVEDADDPVE